MKRIVRVIVKSIMVIALFLCVSATWVYLEFWLPHRTMYNHRESDFQDNYGTRKKIRNACHKVLSHRIGNYYAAFITISEVGNKDSIPYLIRALKWLPLQSQNEIATDIRIERCERCLEQLTGVELGTDYKVWENWWQQTGRHLPFDEEKGTLVLPDRTK